MTIAKPTLPGAVYDALLKADPDVASQYNRAREDEPAAAVAVVLNVNLNWSMNPHMTDPRAQGATWAWGVEPERIARTVEAVRAQITRLMRGDLA